MNLNNTRSAKYGYWPEQIEEQALDFEKGKYFQEIYYFHRFIKVKENRNRKERFDAKLDRRKRSLRDHLEIGEKAERLRKGWILAELLRKKDAPGRLYKSTTENKSFFNREQNLHNMWKIKTKW